MILEYNSWWIWWWVSVLSLLSSLNMLWCSLGLFHLWWSFWIWSYCYESRICKVRCCCSPKCKLWGNEKHKYSGIKYPRCSNHLCFFLFSCIGILQISPLDGKPFSLRWYKIMWTEYIILYTWDQWIIFSPFNYFIFQTIIMITYWLTT